MPPEDHKQTVLTDEDQSIDHAPDEPAEFTRAYPVSRRRRHGLNRTPLPTSTGLDGSRHSPVTRDG
jgi:hypothetical protein